MSGDEEMVWFADRFQEHRPRLHAVAYRMLGSVTDAEDALQEAWIRTTRSDSRAIDNLDAWLVTVVGRVCIDMLRKRRSRREDLNGAWLPEDVTDPDASRNPEQSSLLADSVGLALMVVLDTLDPAERLAFVLHDMFGVPFDAIAPIVDRSPAATRQLASRARRRVRGETAGTNEAPDADVGAHRRLVEAFLTASRNGDFDALLRVLDPDVVFRIDSGTQTSALPQVVTGAHDVAELAAERGPGFAILCRSARANGAAAIVADGRPGIIGVVRVGVIGERIATLDLTVDADVIAGLVIED